MNEPRHKLCFVTASDMTVRAFLIEHIHAASQRYDVCVLTNTQNPDFLRKDYDIDVDIIPVDIARSISPLKDLLALFRLWQAFRRHRFDLVHSVTPKAGLLSALAGCMARVPHRWHTFTGQVWATRSGLFRFFLKQMDKLNVRCTTYTLVDSHSQLSFLENETVVTRGNAGVLADGSVSGVRLDRFRPDSSASAEIRKKHAIAEDAPVCVYLGRLNRDKGVMELASAFAMIQAQIPDAILMLVGPDEESLENELKTAAGEFASALRFVPFTNSPEKYFAAADLFCLPSYREGFGSVVIEAAACGVPAIGSDIYGISDAIKVDETGLLVPAGSVEKLATGINELLKNSNERKRLGKNALERARKHFSSEVVTKALMSEYNKVLSGS